MHPYHQFRLPLAITFVVLVAAFGTANVSRGEEAPAAVDLDQVNNAAHLLAGMDLPFSGSERLAESKSFAYHQSQLDREWREHQERALKPISILAAGEVAPLSKEGGVVRYMFSGPDILHALKMFPKAGTYILCGLEPVGVVPNIGTIRPEVAGRALAEVRNALGEIINFSFFRTKDMKSDLTSATFRGTIPLIMVFLARSGQLVTDYEFMKLQKDGTLESLKKESAGADVVKIEFAPPGGKNTKTLYYFSTDLSNGGFPKSGFATWLAAQPPGDSYLKAASYLMHMDWFGGIRDHLLEHSIQIIEDDSGIPFRKFDPDKWTATLYGVYTKPIDLFAERYQPDLRAAYRANARPLAFGTGYLWRKGQSNLMRFVLKSAKSDPASAVDGAR